MLELLLHHLVLIVYVHLLKLSEAGLSASPYDVSRLPPIQVPNITSAAPSSEIRT